MLFRVIRDRVESLLSSWSRQKLFPSIVGGIAWLSTITLTMPVEILVVVATLLSRPRWFPIAFFAATGSAVASFALYLAFHHLGWALLIEHYPDIANTRAWAEITRWLSDYGVLALFAFMAFPAPVPKVAVLAFAAIYRLPIAEVIAAIWIGKLIKYASYGFIVAHFSHRFRTAERNGPVSRGANERL